MGLSAGLACVILIYIWVSSELGMDRFHANNDRLYQVMSHIKLPDGIHTQNDGPASMGPSLPKDMPEIEYALRVNFAYHIEIGPLIFVLAGISVFLITVLTIGSQAMKAAMANPVNSLRNE